MEGVTNFDVRTAKSSDATVIVFKGDLDLVVADRAREEIERAEAEAEAERLALIVADLRRVSFLDSSGMGVIAAAHMRAIEQQRRFVVVRPPAPVGNAFDVAGLTEIVEMVEDPEQIEGAGELPAIAD